MSAERNTECHDYSRKDSEGLMFTCGNGLKAAAFGTLSVAWLLGGT